jgi:hypothetical protein
MFRMRELIMVMMNNFLNAQGTNDAEGDKFCIHTGNIPEHRKCPNPNDAARNNETPQKPPVKPGRLTLYIKAAPAYRQSGPMTAVVNPC